MLKNYKSTLLLLFGILCGGIVGIIMGEDAIILSPFGTVFLNLMFVIIVPLVFLTIVTSVANIKSPKRLGKIVSSIFIVFLVTSLISCMISIFVTSNISLVDYSNGKEILEDIDTSNYYDKEDVNVLERTVDVLTVNDFSNILSKEHLIALVVFSIMIGYSLNKCRDKCSQLISVLDGAKEVCLKFIELCMYYAPIGLGCYFASLIGTYGSYILVGYVKTFVIYLVLSIVFYLVIYSMYAYISGGGVGVRRFYLNIIPALVTSLSTCSSACSIPVNINSSKSIGVSDDIAETIIPLGTSFHKDGSVIGSVFKIMFLVYLFGINYNIIEVIIVSLIANLLVIAVPIGGGTISEMVIISMMGFPMYSLPILTVIATIIDAPATVLNVCGDTACSMLVARVVDGKNWINNK